MHRRRQTIVGCRRLGHSKGERLGTLVGGSLVGGSLVGRGTRIGGCRAVERGSQRRRERTRVRLVALRGQVGLHRRARVRRLRESSGLPRRVRAVDECDRGSLVACLVLVWRTLHKKVGGRRRDWLRFDGKFLLEILNECSPIRLINNSG